MSEPGSKKKEVVSDESRLKNWKNLDAGQLRKLTPQQKSRYMAYEEPPKDISDAQGASRKRLIELKKRQLRDNVGTPEEDRDEREKHAKLIGQLKAAEARNRLRIMRLRFQANRGQEVSHLISCQPTALNAVRLEALLPRQPDQYDKNDGLDKLDRERCERLVEDEKGLLTTRVA